MLKIDVGQGLKQQDRSKAQRAARARVGSILSAWMRSGQIGVTERPDGRRGRDVKFYCSKGL
jgi:hypothetical protein